MDAPTEKPATLRTLLALAWPIVVSRSSQVVVGVCDAVMVAHLGQAALAASTTGAFNSFSLLILPMGVVFIISSFASQLFGAGDAAGARRYAFYGLLLAAATQALALVSLPLVPAALEVFDYAADVRALIASYIAVRLLSAGAAVGIEALGNYYGGLGNTRLAMVASVASMVLNILGNWLLIDGHWGLPALGVRGAALASTLATWTAFLGFFAFFLRDGRRAGAVLPALSAREFWRMLRFGLPSGLNWFFEFFAFNFFINVVVVGLGTTALAAFMAVLQVNSVAFMPAFAVASAGSILVGQAIGAGKKDAVNGLVWLTLRAAATWQGLAGLAYVAAPEALFRPFLSGRADDATLLEVGARMLALSAAWQVFDATATTLAESLRAAGDTAFTLWARVVIAWAVFVPGAYVTVRRLGGGDAVAVAWVVAYLALLAGVLAVRFRRGAWRRLQLLEGAPPPA